MTATLENAPTIKAFETVEFKKFHIRARYNKRDMMNNVITQDKDFAVSDTKPFTNALAEAQKATQDFLSDKTVAYVWIEKVCDTYDEAGNYAGRLVESGMWTRKGYSERGTSFYPAKEDVVLAVEDVPSTNTLD